MARSTIAVLVVVVTALSAHADEASDLFEEGRELAKQAKWAAACEKFQASLALDPAPGTKLNIGDCLENQGQVRKGWLMFEEAARDFEQLGDARAKYAHERARAAAAKLATLVIKVADPLRAGLTIQIGDRAATPQPEIVERVDPGSLVVTVTAPGAEPFETTATATAGRTTVVEVPALAAARSERDVPRPVAGPTTSRRNRIRLALGLGAGGAVALVASGVVGLVAKSQYDSAFEDGHCFDSPDGPLCFPEGQARLDSAGTKADIATGLAVAGLALGAAAVVIYVTAPKERGVAIAPAATASSVGVTASMQF